MFKLNCRRFMSMIEGEKLESTSSKNSDSRAARVPAKTVRLRDKDHRRFVSSQPCLVCGRKPADAHHLRFAQPRALGRRVSDEFTVPVCRLHHRELHRHGDEAGWWQSIRIDPLPIARRLWQRDRFTGAVRRRPSARAFESHERRRSCSSQADAPRQRRRHSRWSRASP